MARSAKRSKSSPEMEEKASTEYLDVPKRRRKVGFSESEMKRANETATSSNTRKTKRKSLASRKGQGRKTKESLQSLGSRSTGKENKNANKDADTAKNDDKVVLTDSEEIPSTDTATSRKSSKTTNKRASADKDSSSVKRQRVLLAVPKLPEPGGDLLGIGENGEGQLGLTLEVPSAARPKPLKLEHKVVSVVVGGMHTVYLSERGEVYTFGCNDEKALGRETVDEDAAAIPAKVDIPESVVQISAGDSHSAALTSTGKVFIWGNYRDSSGQTGLTTTGRQDTPLQILEDTIVIKIASGDNHFACLSEEGVLYTCGCGEQGQLGRISQRYADRGGRRGIELLLTPSPVHIKQKGRNIEFDEVWTGCFTTFAREAGSGDIYGFGLNNYNQLGLLNHNTEFFPAFITSFLGKKWKMISGGQHHTLALDEDGKVYSMGRKEYGRLGLGENCEDQAEPTHIPLLADKECSCICAGDTVSFAVTDDGKVYSWGMGSNNQLGHGNEDDVVSPQLISSKSMSTRSAISVSAGAQHAMIIARTIEDSSEKASENKENITNKEQST